MVCSRGRLLVCVLVAAAAAGALTNPLTAQQRPPPTRAAGQPGQRPDSIPQPIDTAVALGLGLPTRPSRQFPAADSMIEALLRREGYGATRYAADSLTLFARTDLIRLKGSALVERENSILEADSVTFQQNDCLLLAEGTPTLFDGETVLVGGGMRYDTCERQGIVAEALTKFKQMGVDWYLRGDLAVDSAATRMYGARNDVTTCDHPNPHYHFSAHNVKWVSDNLMVARPAVLYVRDVPVMWLPFIWQDMREGRRSGILVPRFGVNDLVRPNTGYRRQLTNVGYYFAISNYADLRFSLDWFAGNYTAVNGQLTYSWLSQFMSGELALSRMFEEGTDSTRGDRSLRLQWTHNQSFNQRTRLTASVDYATSSRVVERNSLDPLVQTANLGSRINFSKQFDWGTFTLGASRSEDLSNGTVTQTVPNVSLSPAPVNFGQLITWSPSFSLSRNQTLHQQPGIRIPLPPKNGAVVEDSLFFSDRLTTSLRFATPIRVGSWNWRNDFSVSDFRSTDPPAAETTMDPDNPNDSTTLFFREDFSTSVDWNTGINLPTLFPSSWKIQPSLGIQNTTSGAFMVRNRRTGGAFVRQGKRLSFGASSSPALFGFFPGVGPISRIRHSISPRVSWNFQPAADVPEVYARAVAQAGATPQLRSRPVHKISLSLSQVFEGKLRPPPGDTTSDPRSAPKTKLLSIQTSPIEYDFEQAKEEGKNGWVTKTLQNSFTSDLLRGFTLSIAHDLWDGPVGDDTTKFDPFLTSVSARFSLTGATFANILALFTGRETVAEPEVGQQAGGEDLLQPTGTATAAPLGLDQAVDRMGSRPLSGGGLRSSITYDEKHSRPRLVGDSLAQAETQRNLGFQVGFSPSENWSLSWNTQYNITTGEFGQHVLRLDRQLHRWRATFSFVKAPNGNFAFNFYISLRDQPDLKFQYDQRTVNR